MVFHIPSISTGKRDKSTVKVTAKAVSVWLRPRTLTLTYFLCDTELQGCGLPGGAGAFFSVLSEHCMESVFAKETIFNKDSFQMSQIPDMCFQNSVHLTLKLWFP